MDQQTRSWLAWAKAACRLVRFLARQGEPFVVADSRENPPELAALQRDYPQVAVHCEPLSVELLLPRRCFMSVQASP